MKIGFRNHELIKIIMICVYIKPEVKKDDAAAMTTAINEAWELGESESCYLVREIFLVREMSNILLMDGILPYPQGFAQSFRKGAEESIPGEGNKQD